MALRSLARELFGWAAVISVGAEYAAVAWERPQHDAIRRTTVANLTDVQWHLHLLPRAALQQVMVADRSTASARSVNDGSGLRSSDASAWACGSRSSTQGKSAYVCSSAARCSCASPTKAIDGSSALRSDIQAGALAGARRRRWPGSTPPRRGRYRRHAQSRAQAVGRRRRRWPNTFLQNTFW